MKNKQRFNGEGSFYFDKSKNRWYGVLTIGYKDDKPVRRKVSDKTFKGAQKKFNELKEQVSKGVLIEKSACLLPDLILAQIENKKALNLIKESTYSRDLSTLKIIEKASLSKIPVQEISEKDILIFLNKNLWRSESYLKKLYRQLNSAFTYAQSKDLILKNPMQHLRRPKSKKQTKKVYALTVQEQRHLMEALTGPEAENKYSAIFQLLLFTGMRPGEALALDKDTDINFNFNKITIHRTAERDATGQASLSEQPKTESSIRTITMGAACRRLLQTYLKDWKPNPYNLLFYDYENDHILNTNQLNSAFKQIIKKYKIIPVKFELTSLNEKTHPIRFKKFTYFEKSGKSFKILKSQPQDWFKNQGKYYFKKETPEKPFSPHMLRHTFATRCIESGMPVKVLSKILGHSDIQITLNTYYDVFENFESDALKQAESYLERLSLIG